MLSAIESFLRYLHIERNASPLTLKSYSEDLDSLLVYFNEEVENLGDYLSAFCEGKLRILRSVRMTEYIPTGSLPSLSHLEEQNIYCVGSYAQWDDFMDIGSCIKRICRLSTTLNRECVL